jgi:hypothetical protein
MGFPLDDRAREPVLAAISAMPSTQYTATRSQFEDPIYTTRPILAPRRINNAFGKITHDNARAILSAPPETGAPVDYNEAVFVQVCINSAETWSILDKGSWIEDPALKSWWDWLITTEKGKTIGALLADGIGGIICTALSGGNPYWGIAGGILTSVAVAFASWIYPGGWPWSF